MLIMRLFRIFVFVILCCIGIATSAFSSFLGEFSKNIDCMTNLMNCNDISDITNSSVYH